MEVKIFLSLIILSLCSYNVAYQEGSESQGVQCNFAEIMVMTKEEMRREIRQQLIPVRSFPGNYTNRSTCTCSSGDVSISEKLDNLHKAVGDINAMVEEMEVNISAKIEHLLKPVINRINALHRPGKSPSHPAISCSEIFEYVPHASSGEYWIEASDGSAVQRYCDMTFTCDGKVSSGGGWMLVGQMDMTDNSNRCFQELTERSFNSKRLCGKQVSTGCSSVNFTSNGIMYNQVCGKIKGYQHGSTDAFSAGSRNIDQNYVDGVSLTHGGNPRKHIWTFASSVSEQGLSWGCPCTNVHIVNNDLDVRPSFVGNDHFCDTGNAHVWTSQLYENPLWDGVGCGPANTCCSLNRPPWFLKELPSPTRDDIEMRVCTDSEHSDEDIFIETVDIYVR